MENKPLRPLWLIESPDRSGMAVASRHLAAGMCRLGACPLFFAIRDGDSHDEFSSLGCRLEVFPNYGQLLLGGPAQQAAAAAGINVVHALSPDLARRGRRLARNLGAPLFATFNRLEEEEIAAAANLDCQGLVAVSEAIRERMVNLAGVPREQVRVIGNGLDLLRLPRPVFDEDWVEEAGRHIPVIGTLGRLSEKKGQHVFIQAIRLLLDRKLDAEFMIIGDGPDRLRFRRLADELGVSHRITFVPHTVLGPLEHLDLLVEPSLQEGLGMSVMQAMAEGVPVVATGVGGLYDLIDDGETGLMVPAADPQALADAVWNLMENPYQRLELARQARDKLEKVFSCDLMANRLVAFYREFRDAFPDRAGRHGGDAPRA